MHGFAETARDVKVEWVRRLAFWLSNEPGQAMREEVMLNLVRKLLEEFERWPTWEKDVDADIQAARCSMNYQISEGRNGVL